MNIDEVGKLDINIVLKKESLESIVGSFFEQCYVIKDNDSRICKNHEDRGFYIDLVKVKDIKDIHPFFKMHYICRTSAKNIFLSDTEMSDREDKEGWARLYLLESLKSVFAGDRNDKLEDELQINDVEDIKLILQSENKSKRLANYVLKEVENKLRALVKNKSNPNYSFNSKENKFEKIGYLYLDKSINDDESLDNHSRLLDLSLEGFNDSNLSGYICKNYLKYCTNIQKQFIGDFLMYGVAEDGCIYDLENKLLHRKQYILSFKKNIRDRLEKLINDDLEIEKNTYGRWILKEI